MERARGDVAVAVERRLDHRRAKLGIVDHAARHRRDLRLARLGRGRLHLREDGVGRRADRLGGGPRRTVDRAHEGEHVDDHHLGDALGMVRGDHHRDRAAHRMAEDRGALERRRIAGDLMRRAMDDLALGIAIGGRAGEALHLDEMIAIARHGRGGGPPGVRA